MKPPPVEELERVAAYWRWVKDMACEHPELLLSAGQPPVCAECGHPVKLLSEIQIREMRGTQ